MKNKNLLVVMIFFIVLFNSIVYSALNSEMFINGDAHIRVDKDIRITDLVVLEQVNGAYETYNSDYSKNTTSMQITLPSSESFMVYEITITNKGDTDYEVINIVEESYSNSNVKYELIDIDRGIVIDGETTYTFKIKFTTTENNSDNKTTLVLKYDFKEWIPSLYKMVAHKSGSLDTDIDFGVAPTKETSGVYKMNSTKDDEYPVYYYRGILDNNNVSFAGFCWKIVRTTSTGGVKLVYNGVVGSDGSCNNTGEASQIGIHSFDFLYTDKSLEDIKGYIDDWYSTSIIDYTDMLEDTVWCNDKSSSSSGGNYFGAYDRLNKSPYKPDLTCRETDKCTVSSDNGNGLLTYPIALLTADEVALAGQGTQVYSKNGYLHTGKEWWTMTYHSMGCTDVAGDDEASMICFYYPYYISTEGQQNNSERYSSYGVRPAVSLVPGTIVSGGDGTSSNPYTVIEKKITSLYKIVSKGSKLDTDLEFGIVPTINTSGVYKMDSTKNDEYPVYYYRGIVDNNNVKFAGFCWKMVRTTSTGGVKLIYNGVPAEDGSCSSGGEASQIGTSAFNSSYDDENDVRYIYGDNTDSTIKKYIDKWYSKNMLIYTGMLEDTEWCNDRSISGTGWSEVNYGPKERLTVSPYKPSLTCANNDDKYTVNSGKGNGKLTYPVALLTADEAALAGNGFTGYTWGGYLLTGQNWWTLSPSYLYLTNQAYGFSMISSGKLDNSLMNSLYGVRPTISLALGTVVNDGDGSTSNPYIVVEKKDTLYQVISRESKLDTDVDFGVAPTEETSGVYEMNSTKDDSNPVYYYRGIIDNNNVSFAGFCWKIVRTTSTGGVKLIYNGVADSDGSCNNIDGSGRIGVSSFNKTSSNLKYIGYTYDDNVDSMIKTYIDDWYLKNLINYTNMLEDTIWCNDRSVSSTSGSNIYYGVNGRLSKAPYEPNLVCINNEDKYTVSKENGNGLLTYPIALITADELTLAGNGKEYTSSGYLNVNNLWWTMSPSYFNGYNSFMVNVSREGAYTSTAAFGSYGVRPMVSLISNTLVSGGDGSISNPYQIMK